MKKDVIACHTAGEDVGVEGYGGDVVGGVGGGFADEGGPDCEEEGEVEGVGGFGEVEFDL